MGRAPSRQHPSPPFCAWRTIKLHCRFPFIVIRFTGELMGAEEEATFSFPGLREAKARATDNYKPS